MTIPTTMQAIIAIKPGGPEALAFAERPVPVPRACEVLIEVAYAGVCRPDIMQRRGIFTPPPGASDVLGLEVAGMVVACGAEVRELAVGDRVAALLSAGGYAPYAVADARHCLKLPDGMSLRDGAAIPEALFTVWHNLFELGRLGPSEAVLVHGGASGIGTMAVQLAAATGARVLATIGTAAKAEKLRALGCMLPIVYRDEDFVTAVKDGVGAVDVVLDIIGGSYVPRNLSILGAGGRHVSLSFMEGAAVSVDLGVVMSKNLTLTSSTLRPKSADEKARLKRAIEHHAWPLVTAGRVRAVVHAELPLGAAAEAHRILEASEHVGKVVLSCR